MRRPNSMGVVQIVHLNGLRLLTAMAVAGAAVSPVMAADYTRHAAQVPGGLDRIDVAPAGQPIIVAKSGIRYAVSLIGTLLRLKPLPAAEPLPPLPSGALPDAVVVPGGGDVLAAWLAAPTTIYAHGVLGDAIEASELAIRYRDGSMATLRLPADAVFEDRAPRFADLDGDGRDEIILVKSTLSMGAALVAIDPGKPGTPPRIRAETPAIGTPNRWLNPVGAGDVDGDGRVEVLAVITPHIGGTLVAWRLQGDKLVEAYRVRGFSNHAIGSRELGLSLVGDFTGDGIADVLVPDPTRRIMVLVTFTGAKAVVREAFREPDQIAHRALLADIDGNKVPELIYGLADGAVVVQRRAR